MTLFNPSKNNLDEVVFEQRNKLYGAYAIRKAYPNHVNYSMIFTLAPMMLLTVGSICWNYIHPLPIMPVMTKPTVIKEIPDDKEITVSRLQLIMPVIPEVANPFYKIVKKELAKPIEIIKKPEIKPIELSTLLPTTGTSILPVPFGAIGGSTGGAATGTGTGGQGGIQGTATWVDVAAIMPEFPGGAEAMNRFIRDHINYPKVALENGITGKVVVSFVIHTDGSIEVTNLLKGIGFGCDDEALRVIREMPNWTPGSQDGNYVPVRLVLPINFQTGQ